MAKVTVGYFLEDIGHATFLQTLVERVAVRYELHSQPMSTALEHDFRNVTGGYGKALTELESFLRDIRKGVARSFDLLVIAIDGNCFGYVERRKIVDAIITRQNYPGLYAIAIPDPHIEKWYLADAHGLQQILEMSVHAPILGDKCGKGVYKKMLAQLFRDAGIDVRLGGVEYGFDIAEKLDFYTATKADSAFGHFVDELKTAFANIERTF